MPSRRTNHPTPTTRAHLFPPRRPCLPCRCQTRPGEAATVFAIDPPLPDDDGVYITIRLPNGATRSTTAAHVTVAPVASKPKQKQKQKLKAKAKVPRARAKQPSSPGVFSGDEGEDEDEDGDDDDISSLTVAELKRRLLAAGLDATGKRIDLVARLAKCIGADLDAASADLAGKKKGRKVRDCVCAGKPGKEIPPMFYFTATASLADCTRIRSSTPLFFFSLSLRPCDHVQGADAVVVDSDAAGDGIFSDVEEQVRSKAERTQRRRHSHGDLDGPEPDVSGLLAMVLAPIAGLAQLGWPAVAIILAVAYAADRPGAIVDLIAPVNDQIICLEKVLLLPCRNWRLVQRTFFIVGMWLVWAGIKLRPKMRTTDVMVTSPGFKGWLGYKEPKMKKMTGIWGKMGFLEKVRPLLLDLFDPPWVRLRAPGPSPPLRMTHRCIYLFLCGTESLCVPSDIFCLATAGIHPSPHRISGAAGDQDRGSDRASDGRIARGDGVFRVEGAQGQGGDGVSEPHRHQDRRQPYLVHGNLGCERTPHPPSPPRPPCCMYEESKRKPKRAITDIRSSLIASL